jgi:hypothetical protein
VPWRSARHAAARASAQQARERLDDAMAMIARGEIRDGKTIMLLQHAAPVALANS